MPTTNYLQPPQQTQQPQTFNQMQQQGIPRPPSPQYNQQGQQAQPQYQQQQGQQKWQPQSWNKGGGAGQYTGAPQQNQMPQQQGFSAPQSAPPQYMQMQAQQQQGNGGFVPGNNPWGPSPQMQQRGGGTPYTPDTVNPNHQPETPIEPPIANDPYGFPGGGTFNPQQSNFDLGQTLQGNYQNYQGFGGFNGQQMPMPNLPNSPNPLQLQNGGQLQYGPQGQNSNFSVDRYNAITAPQAQNVGQFNSQAGNGLLQQAAGLSQQQMQNPNRYDSPLAQSIYNQMNAQLTSDYGKKEQQVNNDAARRGLYFSTVPFTENGGFADLASAQANQQAGFATQIARDAALAQSGDYSSAISNALGIGGQAYGQDLSKFGANMGANAQNFQQDLASRAFAGDQQAQQVLNSLNRSQFGLQQNAQNFGQQLASNDQTNQAIQNQLGMQLGVGNFNANQNQQNFANQQSNAQLQNQFGQNAFNNNLAAYGANQATNNQNFGQQQQNLSNLFNFGQQQYNNQLSTSQFNSQQDYQNWLMQMQMLGLT